MDNFKRLVNGDWPQLGWIYQEQFKVWTAIQLQYRVAALVWLIGTFIHTTTERTLIMKFGRFSNWPKQRGQHDDYYRHDECQSRTQSQKI